MVYHDKIAIRIYVYPYTSSQVVINVGLASFGKITTCFVKMISIKGMTR